MSFENLGLIEPVLKAIKEAGYTTPTPIQAQAIPAVLAGGDLLAGAQTGTGKTAGFTLPLLHQLMATAPAGNAKKVIRALILTPTRELAAQVEESVRVYGKYLPIRSMVMFGGVGMNPQIDALRRGVDVLVATPGRLLDHHQQGTLDLSHVEFFVLDEADRMLDMGFIHDIKRVLAVLPPKKQSLLFSATFSDEIKALAERLLNSPQVIEVARRNATAETIAQKIHPVDRDSKKELLTHLIQKNNWHQVLVFTRMKHGANRLVEYLVKQNVTAMAIHGNKSQSARTRALADFKAGSLQVLVATDIAARGIDIDQLPHVVNFELPNVPEDYVHRIGRTGRAGSEGEALSLVCIDEEGFLADIEKLIKRSIPRELVPGFEPDPNARAEPIQLGRRVLNGAPGARPGGGGGGGRGGRPGGGNGGGTRQGQGASGGQRSPGGSGRGGQGAGSGGQAPRARTR
jgi:ATP-dependent RNA helicase RhlE